MTIKQVIKKNFRKKRRLYCRVRALDGCPQKLAVCRKIFILKPKKPNSANRKVAKVEILSTNRMVVASIPGIGHGLQRFSKVLLRGGNPCDLPGVHYKMIRGVLDFKFRENIRRTKRCSKFGISAKKARLLK